MELTVEQKLISFMARETMVLEFIKKILENFYTTSVKIILNSVKPGQPILALSLPGQNER